MEFNWPKPLENLGLAGNIISNAVNHVAPSWIDDINNAHWTKKWGWNPKYGDSILKWADQDSFFNFDIDRDYESRNHQFEDIFGLDIDIDIEYDWSYEDKFTNFWDWFWQQFNEEKKSFKKQLPDKCYGIPFDTYKQWLNRSGKEKAEALMDALSEKFDWESILEGWDSYLRNCLKRDPRRNETEPDSSNQGSCRGPRYLNHMGRCQTCTQGCKSCDGLD